MNQMSLSRVVLSQQGDRLVTFERAAYLTQTSVTVLESFAQLGLIDPVGAMLRLSDLNRVEQIIRLRRDLGLNLVGAAMVLDMAAEIAQLKAEVRALRHQKF
jgi:MerR family transcriptional regulator/heat shock protein HspR/chaperone modulatory protein CbpM